MKQKGKDLKIWSQKKERHIVKRSVKQKGKDIIRARAMSSQGDPLIAIGTLRKKNLMSPPSSCMLKTSKRRIRAHVRKFHISVAHSCDMPGRIQYLRN